MPVILPPKVHDAWMYAETKAGKLEEILKPYPETLMEVWPVGKSENSPKNNAAQLLEPLSLTN